MKEYLSSILSKLINCGLAALLLWGGCLYGQPRFIKVPTGSTASLRGLAAVSAQVCWTSGSSGRVYKTINRGQAWQDVSPYGYEALDFRDIAAFTADSAYILSAGSPGVVLLTTDGGEHWEEVFRNDHPDIFYDAFDFFADGTGIGFGDAIDGRLQLIKGKGQHWQAVPHDHLPRVLAGQGGFAASGSCLQSWGDSTVAIVLGNKAASVLISHDRGSSWQTHSSPLDFGEASKGNFSLDIFNDSLWVISGGDYRGDSLSNTTLAISYNGGRKWQLPAGEIIQGKYLSSVIFIDEYRLLACSHRGCYYTADQGKQWLLLPDGFYSLSIAKDDSVWASGKMGLTAYLIY